MIPPGNECDVKDEDGTVLALAFDGVCSDICCPDLPSLKPDGECSDTQDCTYSVLVLYPVPCDSLKCISSLIEHLTGVGFNRCG